MGASILDSRASCRDISITRTEFEFKIRGIYIFSY